MFLFENSTKDSRTCRVLTLTLYPYYYNADVIITVINPENRDSNLTYYSIV